MAAAYVENVIFHVPSLSGYRRTVGTKARYHRDTKAVHLSVEARKCVCAIIEQPLSKSNIVSRKERKGHKVLASLVIFVAENHHISLSLP